MGVTNRVNSFNSSSRPIKDVVVSLDTETSGFFISDDIIQISIKVVKMANGKIVEKTDEVQNDFNSYIFLLLLHGIKPISDPDSPLHKAPSFPKVLSELMKFLDKFNKDLPMVLVCHNLSFDTRMLFENSKKKRN